MKQTIEQNNYRNNLVVKSNTLMEGKYFLSVREQKFIIFLVSLIDKGAIDMEETTIKIKDIETALKTDVDKKWGSIYSIVKELTHSLQAKSVEIRQPDGSWEVVGWFSRVKASTRDGTVTFAFTKHIKTHLLELRSHFSKYKFGNILSLKSGYSIRMYELLKFNQFKGVAKYEIGNLRELLGVSYKEKGKWIHKYEEYKIFKNRVIKYAQKELKKETDIYFEIKEEREKRRVKYITFYIFKNKESKQSNQKELFEGPIEIEEVDKDYPYDAQILSAFIEIGLTEDKAKKLYKDGFNSVDKDHRQKVVTEGLELDEYFRYKIAYTKTMMENGEVANPVGLLISAIKNNYTSKDLEKQKKEAKRQKKALKVRQTKQDLEAKRALMAKEISYRENQIIKKIYLENPNLYVEVLNDKNPELWIGYDKAKTLNENCEHAKGGFKAKITNLIKEQYASEFEIMATDIAEYQEMVNLINSL